MKAYGDTDNKFRFVILASKRAKQLLQGVKPKIKSKSKNPIRVAQNEVREGLVDYEIVEPKKEEVHEPGDVGFIGEEIGSEAEEISKSEAEAVKKRKEKPEVKPKKKVKKKAEKKGTKKKKQV